MWRGISELLTDGEQMWLCKYVNAQCNLRSAMFQLMLIEFIFFLFFLLWNKSGFVQNQFFLTKSCLFLTSEIWMLNSVLLICSHNSRSTVRLQLKERGVDDKNVLTQDCLVSLDCIFTPGINGMQIQRFSDETEKSNHYNWSHLIRSSKYWQMWFWNVFFSNIKLPATKGKILRNHAIRCCYWLKPSRVPDVAVCLAPAVRMLACVPASVLSEEFAAAMNFKIRPATKADCKDVSRMIMVRKLTLATQCATERRVFVIKFSHTSSTLLPRSWQCLKKCPIKWRYLQKVLSGTISYWKRKRTCISNLFEATYKFYSRDTQLR